MGFAAEDTGGGAHPRFASLVTQTVSGLNFYIYMLFWIDADWGRDGMGDCVRGDQ